MHVTLLLSIPMTVNKALSQLMLKMEIGLDVFVQQVHITSWAASVNLVTHLVKHAQICYPLTVQHVLFIPTNQIWTLAQPVVQICTYKMTTIVFVLLTMLFYQRPRCQKTLKDACMGIIGIGRALLVENALLHAILVSSLKHTALHVHLELIQLQITLVNPVRHFGLMQ